VESTFDFDSENWLIIGDNDAQWSPTGGNPGGCFNVNDLATGQGNIAAAPNKFLGDWSAVNSGDHLSFDVYFQNISGGRLLSLPWMFRITGPGGKAIGLVPASTPPQNVWSNVSVSMDPSDWVVESGTWPDLLSEVTSLELLVEYVDGDEIVRLDNIRLNVTPVPVFDPCAASHFNGTGIDTWSYQDAGAMSNPGDDGNGGGFLRFGDASGNSYAFTPSRFLGDWSALNNNGYVTLDIRVLSSSGNNLGSPEFVRLSGPGGAAHVSLAAGDLPTSGRIWKNFRFLLNASEWTLDSGSWTGLMAEITACRIDVEFFDNTELIGLDNFGRMLNTCPPIDAPVTVHSSDVTLCGTHSFIDAGTLGLDPSSGKLYATVREPGSGGGIFAFSGPTPGLKLHAYDYPAGLLFDDDGDGYLSQDYSGVVNRFVGSDSSMVWVSGFHSGDDDPYGMTFAPTGFNGANVTEGDILVVDRGSGGADQIWAFSPDAPENEQLVKPDPGNVDWFDIVADDVGRVWVVDTFVSGFLYQLAPDGSFTSLPLASPIPSMHSIVYDPGDGMLYVAGWSPQALYRVNPGNGSVTLIADGFQGMTPAALEVDASMRRLWLADYTGDRVYEFCLPGWTGIDPPVPKSPGISLRAVPNPFSGVTEVRFTLPTAGEVELCVYDIAGRQIRKLADGVRSAGPHAIRWDGRDQGGRSMSRGVFFIRLRVDQDVFTEKIVCMKGQS
jgi:hypothetical protein